MRFSPGAQRLQARPACLRHFTHRDRAPCQVWRQARAGRKCRDGARHLKAIIASALAEKALQRGQGSPPTALLAMRARIIRKAEFCARWNMSGPAATGRLQCAGCHDRFRHVSVPCTGPAVARVQPPDNAELPCLMPWHACFPRPCGNRQVARIGPAIAGFLMAPERGNAVALVNPLENGDSIAHHHAQRLAELCE